MPTRISGSHAEAQFATTGGVGARTKAYGGALTAGSLLVVSVTTDIPATVTVSDGTNGAYTQAGTYIASRLSQWYFANNASSGTPTVSVTPSIDCRLSVSIDQYTGAATASPVRATASSTGTAVTTGVGGTVASASGDLAVMAFDIFASSAAPVTDHGGIRPQMYPVYGMQMVGCRGAGTVPVIIKVNTLADTGAGLVFESGAGTTSSPFIYHGEFRAAVTFNGPRLIVFEVCGYIDINSDIVISNPYMQIAGQTAPGKGITIRMVPDSSPSSSDEAMIILDSHDLLLQHFRIRPGWGNVGPSADSICNSGIQMYGGHAFYVVYDHLSISWAQDENISMAYVNYLSGLNSGNTDAALWRCLVAEGLNNAPNSGGCTGGGFSPGHGVAIGGQSKHNLVMQSVIACNLQRNPYANAGSHCYMNNLIYDWNGAWGFTFGNYNADGSVSTNAWQHAIVGNRMVIGPDSNDSNVPGAAMFWFSTFGETEVANNKSYRSDNTSDNAAHPSIAVLPLYRNLSYDPTVGSWPTEVPQITGYTPLASTAVEAFALPNAGARPLDPDAIDIRIKANITARTSNGYVTSPAAVGGYPPIPFINRPFVVPSNPFGVGDAVGRTNIEIYVESNTPFGAQRLEP